MSTHPPARPSRRLPLLVGAALALGLLPLLSESADAVAPTASFLSPNDDGPGNVVSDKPASLADDFYTFSIRAGDTDGTITSVALLIEDGDADTDFEAIGTAVADTATPGAYVLFWNQSAHTPATDVDDDAGIVRAVVTDSNGESTIINQNVVFADATAETAFIEAVTAGGAVSGDASAGATGVTLYYSTTASPGADPVYTTCGTATVSAGTAPAVQQFSGTCSLGAVDPATVVAIGARAVGGTGQAGHAVLVAPVPAATTTTIAPTTTTAPTATTTPGTTGPQASGEQGYALVAADGGIFSFGTAKFFGSTGSLRLNQPVVAMDHTPTTTGYWLAAADGGIFAFGDARFFGSTGAVRLARPIVGMRGTPTGNGYWLVASDGGVFAFGDARFFGSTGATRLNQPIVGMERTPSGNGYWLVAADGGIFAFGDAVFRGSTGATRLNRPIVGMARSNTGLGYQLVASDGGIFAFGDAVFYGSTGAITLNSPITAMAPTAAGTGYWLCARDGGVFAFGNAQFRGSMGATRLNQPVVGCDAPLAQTGIRT